MDSQIEKSCSGLASALVGMVTPDPAMWEKFCHVPITNLCYDSRRANAESLFFCLVGKTADGHHFASAAYHAGCRLFAVERPLDLPGECLQMILPDTRAALADCAAAYYGHPERELRLVGITGTKGKTTTALLLRAMLEAGGIPTGYIGTNGVEFGREHYDTLNSTPESLEIYRYLRRMADCGISACVMEISSQALWMGRVRGLAFDATLFTNLSRDHMGGIEHPDMAHYMASKRLLFTRHTRGTAVFNLDDPAAPYMATTPDAEEGENAAHTVDRLTFSTKEDASVISNMALPSPLWFASEITPARHGNRIGVSFICRRGEKIFDGRWFLPFPGDFNVQNALGALTVACECFNVPPTRTREALARMTVKGRFETLVHEGAPGAVFVIDYAHNGASLTSILDALRAYQPHRLIALFGSVGGRTYERRGDLARAAGPRCDLCILTADNPGSEPVENILAEIDAAFPDGSCPRLLEADRTRAIQLAVDLAEPGDIILLAGKGHEDYQLIGTEMRPFSDNTALRAALTARAERTDTANILPV